MKIIITFTILIILIVFIIYALIANHVEFLREKAILTKLNALSKDLLDNLYKQGITDINIDYDVCGYKAIVYYNTNTDNWCIITANDTNNPHVVITHKELEMARQLFFEAMKYGNKIKDTIKNEIRK